MSSQTCWANMFPLTIAQLSMFGFCVVFVPSVVHNHRHKESLNMCCRRHDRPSLKLKKKKKNVICLFSTKPDYNSIFLLVPEAAAVDSGAVLNVEKAETPVKTVFQ